MELNDFIIPPSKIRLVKAYETREVGKTWYWDYYKREVYKGVVFAGSLAQCKEFAKIYQEMHKKWRIKIERNK